MEKPDIRIFFTVLLLAAVCFAGAAAAEEEQPGNQTVSALHDEIDSLHPQTVMAGEYVSAGVESVSTDVVLLSADSDSGLPVKYDLRDYGYVTPVRSQEPYGVCWAFATMGALESNILKNGYVSADDAEELDLSELHLVYYTVNRDGVTRTKYLEEFAGIGDAYTEKSTFEWYDYDYDYYSRYGLYQLVSGIGAATEDNPLLRYSNMDSIFQEGMTLDPALAVTENTYYLENADIINKDDRDEIKEHLMKYGAAVINYYADGQQRIYSYSEEPGVYDEFILCKDSYYQNEHTGTNHEVILVGWDDTYPAENFAGYAWDDGYYEIDKPSNDGAWLIKNSWGAYTYTDGDGIEKYWDGYMWISYEDTSLSNVISFNAVPAYDFYDTIYQYDLGTNGDFYLYNEDKKPEPGEMQTIAGKNVYTAEKNEAVTAVMFGTRNTNVDYRIVILVNGTPVLTEPLTGTERNCGMHTVYLPERIPVKAGDTMEVIVELSMMTASESTVLGLPVDLTYYITDSATAEFSNYVTPTDYAGRSYVKYEKYDGESSWKDISEYPAEHSSLGTVTMDGKYGSARIKLYTVDVIERNVDSAGTADFSGDNVQVQKIRFTDAASGTTVTYVDKLSESEKPEEDNYQVIGGFSVEVGEGYQEGTKAAVTFTADSAYPDGVKLMHRASSGDWETLATEYTGNDEYTAETTSFSPFAVVQYEKVYTKSSSSVTSFFGTKDGSDFTFKRAVVITKATLPGATYATVINTSGSGWYNCSLSTDGTNGTVYFQVPLDVLDVKGYTVNDVSMLGCRTTYLSSDDQYAKYSAVINGAGSYTIDFETDASAKAVTETKPVTETPKTEEPVTTVETPVTTPVTTEKPATQTAATSPFPVLGILAGLGIAALFLRRR